tara:strand:- start:674 stop:859 length:186 start_codon:yes stop_codon:yes gene_type:complete
MKNTAIDKTQNTFAVQKIVNKMNSVIRSGGTRYDCIKALKKAEYNSVTIICLMDKVIADIK